MKLMYIPENKIVKALCCLAFLTASACIDAVDDYYTGGETATREGSVLEYLEKTPDYSDFVNLVAETGMTLPLILAVLFLVIGLAVMGVEYFKKDK